MRPAPLCLFFILEEWRRLSNKLVPATIINPMTYIPWQVYLATVNMRGITNKSAVDHPYRSVRTTRHTLAK